MESEQRFFPTPSPTPMKPLDHHEHAPIVLPPISHISDFAPLPPAITHRNTHRRTVSDVTPFTNSFNALTTHSPTIPTRSPSLSGSIENDYQSPIKAKRKRASPEQIRVLNAVFDQTFFPSTELRLRLAHELGMSPRAIQIWFQNKRQNWRVRNKDAAGRGLRRDEIDLDRILGRPAGRVLSDEHDEIRRGVDHHRSLSDSQVRYSQWGVGE